MLFSFAINAQSITGSKKIDIVYTDLIKANGSSLQKWAVKRANSGSSMKKTPYGEMGSLRKIDQERILLAIQVEKIRKLKKEIKVNKSNYDLRTQKEKELAVMLRKTEKLASSVLKKKDDTDNAVIGKI